MVLVVVVVEVVMAHNSTLSQICHFFGLEIDIYMAIHLQDLPLTRDT